jgi:hypothetical protein
MTNLSLRPARHGTARVSSRDCLRDHYTVFATGNFGPADNFPTNHAVLRSAWQFYRDCVVLLTQLMVPRPLRSPRHQRIEHIISVQVYNIYYQDKQPPVDSISLRVSDPWHGRRPGPSATHSQRTSNSGHDGGSSAASDLTHSSAPRFIFHQDHRIVPFA